MNYTFCPRCYTLTLCVWKVKFDDLCYKCFEEFKMFISKDNIKGGEGCRNCDLIFYYHKEYTLTDDWYSSGNNRYICPCTNYEPKDNLKYLELKYMQKKQEKYDINKLVVRNNA